MRVLQHARRAGRNAEGLAVPLERLERLQLAEPLARERRCRRRAPRPSRSPSPDWRAPCRRTPCDISWPPRQWPSTGTSLRTASRISSSTGAIHGSSSFTLIGPPMNTRPEKRRGSRGTRVALVERAPAATQSSGARGRWQNSPALRCARMPKNGDRLHAAPFYCALCSCSPARAPRRRSARRGRADRRDRRARRRCSPSTAASRRPSRSARRWNGITVLVGGEGARDDRDRRASSACCSSASTTAAPRTAARRARARRHPRRRHARPFLRRRRDQRPAGALPGRYRRDLVAMPAARGDRLGIDYRKGQRGGRRRRTAR